MSARLLLAAWVTCIPALAQQGDKAGESQTNVVPRELIPPSPVLQPDQALKSFKLQPGFRIELVASEPLVHEPIQIAFDPAGRIWVLEMRGFMPNVDGLWETNKVGDVVFLEDTDGDGRMDKRTVFLDDLVMPRSIALIRGGVLVAEPPFLWFCRDTDGDGKCDDRTEVASDYATQADPKLGLRANPEHSPNGLLLAIDNWIYSANHTVRFRSLDDNAWQREPTIFRGQWGISQDNFGRLFYNSNEDPLRADLVPSVYLNRNPNYRKPAGANIQLYSDKAVWSARVNPGVNRGYRKGQLRPDGRLATFTSASAPLVYRGDNFRTNCVGDVYVCEPAGNLIRQFAITDNSTTLKATNAYDQSEFLASTDERFRPVNLALGPDGCLYIADMYRGIIQHRNYVTSYLRQQSLDRGLDKPTGLGRIYRIVAEAKERGPAPNLAIATSAELVNALSHPNGWRRDTAQRLLVERNDAAAIGLLRQLIATNTNPLARLQALWTLEGMRQIDSATLKGALADTHPNVRAAAIRMSEPLLPNHPELTTAVIGLLSVSDPSVQLQLALTLGQLKDSRAEAALATILTRHATNPFIRDAVLTGLAGRELEFLLRLLVDRKWQNASPGYSDFLGRLARCVFTEARGSRVNSLLEITSAAKPIVAWQRSAMIDGIVGTNFPGWKIRKVRLPAEPEALATLRRDPELVDRIKKLGSLITWPGKPGEQEIAIKALSAEEQKRFDLGKELFLASCAPCHQPHGMGQDGLAPPLVDSEWVLGPPERLARIALHGVRGKLNVGGQTYDLDMPSFGVLDDEQIAAILTCIRRSWDHGANPVDPALVKSVRAMTAKRDEAWSEAELLAIP